VNEETAVRMVVKVYAENNGELLAHLEVSMDEICAKTVFTMLKESIEEHIQEQAEDNGNAQVVAHDLAAVLDEMHRIANPGEYGLGDALTDKQAWVRMGELIDQARKMGPNKETK
jgi:hypothetical protein